MKVEAGEDAKTSMKLMKNIFERTEIPAGGSGLFKSGAKTTHQGFADYYSKSPATLLCPFLAVFQIKSAAIAGSKDTDETRLVVIIPNNSLATNPNTVLVQSNVSFEDAQEKINGLPLFDVKGLFVKRQSTAGKVGSHPLTNFVGARGERKHCSDICCAVYCVARSNSIQWY